MSEYLNPGSLEAIDKGCKCPILDNNYGKGSGMGSDEALLFWTNWNCPLHGGDKPYDID